MLFAQCWRSPRWPRASRSWRDSALRTRPISRKFQEGELHGLNITSRHASIIAKLTTQAHHGVLLTPEALQAGVFRLTCPKSPLPPHSQALQVSADFGNLHAYFETFSVWLLGCRAAIGPLLGTKRFESPLVGNAPAIPFVIFANTTPYMSVVSHYSSILYFANLSDSNRYLLTP